MSVFALKHAPQQVKSFTQDLSIKLFCPDCKKDPPLPLPVPSSPSTSTSTTVTIDENGNQIIIQNETGEGGGEGEQGGNEGAEVVKKENENETSGLGTLIEEFGSGDLLCGQCGKFSTSIGELLANGVSIKEKVVVGMVEAGSNIKEALLSSFA